ncbi:unnamed protein product [Eruca vesicaria subsp. sativa]|uniref:Uncharacterized protein n=1 Tax=Eruca vesicaria subsp. sativa TaxID=29727 RepID=A0ABC8JU52_ERUVS|nr:unnamed protein product [Eruca vesicaria subsp. sativa]
MEHYNTLGEVIYHEKVKHWRLYGDRFRGLEKQEGKWVEIFVVEVGRAHSRFKAAKSKFTLTATGETQIHIIDPLNDQLYFEFKGIHEIPHMSHKEKNFPIGGSPFDDLEGPKMVFYIRDNMGGRQEVIVVLKMCKVRAYLFYSCPTEEWLQTEGDLSDFRFKPRLPEVEEFRQSVNNSDPHVRKYGAIGPL